MASALAATPVAARADEPIYTAFASPEDVPIAGYSGDAMEPFLTPDGRFLLFNNRNEPAEQTDIFHAENLTRQAGLEDKGVMFGFRGPLAGVNAPGALDGVPSMSRDGELYFVSTRSYGTSFSTLYRARVQPRAPSAESGTVLTLECVVSPKLVGGVSRKVPGYVNFDVTISADGNTLAMSTAGLAAPAIPCPPSLS